MLMKKCVVKFKNKLKSLDIILQIALKEEFKEALSKLKVQSQVLNFNYAVLRCMEFKAK